MRRKEGRNEKDKYYVAAQNLEPNTEIKYTFQKDEEGNDENGLISSQTVEEILLYVKEVGNTRRYGNNADSNPNSSGCIYILYQGLCREKSEGMRIFVFSRRLPGCLRRGNC